MAFALAILLPALLVAAVTTWQAADGYRIAFQAQLQDTAQALAMALDASLAEDFALLEALAADPALDADASPGDREAWLRHAAVTLGRNLALVDSADGQYLMHTAVPPGGSLPRTPLIGTVAAVVQTGRPVVTNLVDGPVMGRPIIGLAIPVVRGGRILFVLSTRLEPSAVLAQMLAQDLPKHAFAVVLDGRGRIVARTLDHEASLGRMSPIWRAEAEAGRARGSFEGNSLEGKRVLGTFAHPHAAPGWTVAVLMARADYVRTWTRPLALLAAATVPLLLLSAVMALRLARRLLRPVEALRRHAHTVVAGTPAACAAPPSSGVREFDDLRADIAAAEATLRRAEHRWRGLFEGMQEGFSLCELIRDPTGRVVDYRRLEVNPAFERIFGIPANLALRHTACELIPNIDRSFIEALAQVAETAVPMRKLTCQESLGRWFESHLYPAEGGRVCSIFFEVTERKQAEERQALLAREVDHRAKNILAVVQAALRLTPKDDAESYARTVEGRITSLARAHNLLARDGWRGADLRALVAGELAPFAGSIAGDGESGGTNRMGPIVELDGPAVMLQADLVQPLAMVMHELATNAVKYGALSVPEGRVAVSWRFPREEPGQLRLCWTETGGPAVGGKPDRTGFGTRVLQGSVRGQLGGTISLTWKPTGLVCELTVPFKRLARPIEARDEVVAG